MCYPPPHSILPPPAQCAPKEETLEETVLIVCADQSPVATSPHLEKEKKGVKFIDQNTQITKDDVFKLCVQKRMDWTAEEIDQVWEVLMNYQSPIRDWFKFVEGTIKNFRKMAGIKQYNEKQEGNEKWNNNQYKQNSKSQDSDTEHSTKQSPTSNEETSKTVTLGQALQELGWTSILPGKY